jgi:hypothetical protein
MYPKTSSETVAVKAKDIITQRIVNGLVEWPIFSYHLYYDITCLFVLVEMNFRRLSGLLMNSPKFDEVTQLQI